MSQKFKPSVYQQGLFDYIANEKGNALVSAVAGSGKSTSLIKAMGMINPAKTVRFFAFGRDIVADLKTKIPQSHNISVSTIHAYGMKSVMQHCEVKPEVDDRKYHKLFDHMYIDMKDGVDSKADCSRRVMPLISLARVNMAMVWEDIFAMVDKYDLAATEEDCKLALSMIKRGTKELGTMDMTDMIWLPVVLKMRVDKFDFIMIDECQDLSELQRTLVLMAIKKGGRFIAVGDPHQAIFGFAGSDVDSFNKFKLLPDVKELPLSVCYRCPKDVIEFAKKLVPHIEASEFAGKGEVNFNDKVASIVAGDMILCRSTYPIVKLGFQYLSAGIKARIAGRDIGKSLITMIRKTKAVSFDSMYEKFAIELEKMESDLIRTKGLPKDEVKNNTQYAAYVDKIDAIRVVGEGCSDIDEVIEKIDGIFSDDKGEGIVLSTIHKAKGLEADNVYIIHAELMPSKNAKLAWQYEQELNLMYVAYTRPKKKLGFITDFDAYSAENVVKKGQGVKSPDTSEDKANMYRGARGLQNRDKTAPHPNSIPKLEPVNTVEEAKMPKAGEIVTNEYTITSVVEMNTQFGSTKKYIMTSKSGVVVTKIGSMQHAKVLSGSGLKEGSIVKLRAPVKGIFNNQVELGMLVSVE